MRKLLCITALLFATVARAQTITYPILVMAEDNATAVTQVTQTTNTATPDRMFLRVNNLRYNNKGRVRLNNGTAKSWVQFNTTNATCAVPENLGCMSVNAYGVVRFTFAIPSDWTSGGDPFVSGSNTFDFEMTVPGSSKIFVDNGHGYRILWIDFLESGDGYTGSSGVTNYWRAHGGDPIIGKTGSPLHVTDTIVWTDYSSTAFRSADLGTHFNNSASEAQGKVIFETATITDNQGNATSAKCASCHVKNGKDLAYWRFENKTIIEVAKARNLSTTDAQKIAAYIRSLDDDFTLSNGTTPANPPGYPWCDPYQPGDSYVTGQRLSASDTFYWPAGSCNVLDYDSDASARYRLVLSEWDIKDINADYKYEDIPIAESLPCYHCWLPIEHVMDYASGSWNDIEPKLTAYQATGQSLGSLNTSGHQLNVQVQTSKKVGQGAVSTQQWSRRRLDVVRLAAMKHLERQFFTDGDYHVKFSQLFGQSDGVPSQARSWMHKHSRSVFDVAPHISSAVSDVGGYEFSEVGVTTGQLVNNHKWYQLARYLTPGWDPASSAQGPVDNQYQISFMYNKATQPIKFSGTVFDQLDMLWKVRSDGSPANTSTELTRARGWTPNTMNVYFFGRVLWDDGGINSMLSVDRGPTLNAMLQAWYDVISPYAPYTSPVIARGVERYEFDAIGTNPSGGATAPFGIGANEWNNANNFYTFVAKTDAVPGVNKNLLNNVATMWEEFYGSSTNWNAVVSGDTGPPPVTLSVTYPAGGEAFEAGSTVIGAISTSGTDSMLVFLQKNSVTIATSPDSVASNSGFSWTLDAGLTPDTDYRFGVSSASGPITAYSGVFEVEAPDVTPTDSTDATMGELTKHEWSGSCSFEAGNVIQASGDFGVAQPNDNGCAWLRPLHSFEKVSVTIESIVAPWVGSTVSLVMSKGTDSTSAMVAVDISQAAEADSVYVRLSVRRNDDGPRRYVTRTPQKVSVSTCLRLRHVTGVIYGEYSNQCTGTYTAVGNFSVAWTPLFAGIHANSRTGVAGPPVEAVVYNMKREQ